MQKIWNKGHLIRASDKHLVYHFSIGTFLYNAVVELVNPIADTVSRKTYTGADVDWYVKAEDIVLKNKGNHNAGNPQNSTPQGQPKK